MNPRLVSLDSQNNPAEEGVANREKKKKKLREVALPKFSQDREIVPSTKACLVFKHRSLYLLVTVDERL